MTRRAAQQVRHAPKSPPSKAETGDGVEGQDGASTALGRDRPVGV